MKWIAVILVLLNVVAYLLGMRAPVDTVKSVQSGEHEQINGVAMSVIRPEEARAQEVDQKETDAALVAEDSLTALKIDQQGQVLMSKNEQPEADQANAQAIPPPKKASSPPKKQAAQAEEKQQNAQAAKQKQAEAPLAKNPTKIASAEKPATDTATVAPTLSCYRLGPFKNPKRLASLRQKLDSQDIAYKLDKRDATRQIKAVRVYIGPYGDDGALKAQKQQLEKMNIDHFLIRLQGERLLQLGYFSEPERATNYQKLMQAKGLPVKTETIYLEGTTNNAIELAQISEGAIKALDVSKGVSIKAQACQ